MNGTQKVVVGIHVMKFNHIFIHHNQNSNRRKYAAEIRSRNWNPVKSPTKFVIYYTPSVKKSLHELNAEVTFLHPEIPLAVIFFALGAKDEKEIFECIIGTQTPDSTHHEMMINIINDMLLHEEVQNLISVSKQNYVIPDDDRHKELPRLQREAMIYIGCRSQSSLDLMEDKTDEERENVMRNRIGFAKEFLNNSLLSHMGTSNSKHPCNFREKLMFLGMMTRRLLNVICGLAQPDNREKLMHRRVELDCAHFKTLASLFMKKMVKEAVHRLKNFVDSDRPSPGMLHVIAFKHSKLYFTHFLMNGMIPNMTNGKSGLTNTYFQFNRNASATNLIKNDTPVRRESKDIKVRELENDRLRYNCPTETPEGQNVGLHGFDTVLTTISTGDNPFDLFDIIDEYSESLITCSIQKIFGSIKVILDGMWKWITDKPYDLCNRLRTMKRRGEISWQTTIDYNKTNQIIYIECSEGRFLTPAFVVETDQSTGKQYVSINKHVKNMATKQNVFHPILGGWEWLLYQGYVEYVGPDELQDSDNMICMYLTDLNKDAQLKYKWCEIHPTIVFSYSGSIIPWLGLYLLLLSYQFLIYYFKDTDQPVDHLSEKVWGNKHWLFQMVNLQKR